MSTLDAILLGLVQGLTEFLPVSSSGHLELVKAIQNQDLSGESSMFMTVLLHFATALSTVIVFRKDIFEIIKGLFAFKNNDSLQFSLKIVLSMIPAAIVGVFFDDIIEGLFDGKIALVGSMLILTGLLLFVANKAKTTSAGVSFPNALIIGIAQAIAILPGISRSGATIATSVLLGVDREKSARFSFLMVVPLIFGKIAKDLLSSDEITTVGISNTTIIAGFIMALVTGIIACTWMIKIVKRSKLSYFAYYCFVVGIVALFFSFK
jgi:undecaprenyl-diphosphatase